MKHYVTNGLKFRTKDSEKNKKTQNSGLSVVTNGGVAYYVIVTNIIELNYSNKIRHVLFKCKWVDVLSIRGYKIDELGFPLVNFTRLIHVGDELMDEPYVLASEASQVFYVEDKRDKDWFVVVKTKARDVFDAGKMVVLVHRMMMVILITKIFPTISSVTTWLLTTLVWLDLMSKEPQLMQWSLRRMRRKMGTS